MLCEILAYLVPVFDLLNQILAVLGLEIDFMALFGCGEEPVA